jgi:hypothetical protein
MIRDGHPACRLKPASPAVPAASAKEDNKNNNDDKRLGIHDVKPFQCDGFGLGFSTISAFARMPSPSLAHQIHQLKRITQFLPWWLTNAMSLLAFQKNSLDFKSLFCCKNTVHK